MLDLYRLARMILVTLAFALSPVAAGAADLIDHSFGALPGGWQTVCDDPVVGRFTITGPGTLIVRESRIVYTQAEFLQPNTGGFQQRVVFPGPSGWEARLRPIRGRHDIRSLTGRSPDGRGKPGESDVFETRIAFEDAGPISIEIGAKPVCEWSAAFGRRQVSQRMRVEVFAEAGAQVRIDFSTGSNIAGTAETLEPLWNNANVYTVANGPTNWTEVAIDRPFRLLRLTTYHWNDGRGATPGTIVLVGLDGRIYGPWPARGAPGQGGVPNANWIVEPDLRLPAGRYIVVDSDPSTWAQNEGTGGAGMIWLEGRFE